VGDTNVRVVFSGSSIGAVRASDQAADSIKKIGRAGQEAAHGVDEIRERAEAGTRAINEERRAMDRLKVASLLGGTATAGKWGLMAAGIASLGAAAVGATASLAPLAGSVAVLPGLLTAAGIALGTVKLATDGLSEALKGNKKALEELTPAGRAFVATLKTFEPLIDKLRTTAQAGLFPGLLAGLNQLKQPAVFATINTAIGQMAKALGGVAEGFGKVIGSQKFLSTFAVVAQAAAHWMQQFGIFAVKSFDAMISLTKAAIPLTNWMGDLSVRFATWLDNSIKAASASGKLQGFFEGVRKSIELIGHALGQLGLALFDVGKIAKPFGDDLFRALDKGATAVAKFAESAKGKAEIKAFFDSVEHALKGLAPIAGALLQGIARVIPHLLNALGDLGQALGPALVPMIHLAAGGLIFLLDQISRFAKFAGPYIVTAVDMIAHALPRIMDAASSVVSYFRSNFLPPLVGIFHGVVDAARALVGVIRANWPQITSIARSVASNVRSALTLIEAAVKAVAPIVRALGPVFHLAFIAVALEMRAMAAVVRVQVAILTAAMRGVGAIAHAMAAAVKAAINAVKAAWNALKGVVATALKFHVPLGPLSLAVGAIHAVISAWKLLESAASHVINFKIHVPSIHWPSIPHPFGIGRAAGGFIPGSSPGAPVPILAHAGEVVLNQAQQAMLGGPRAIAQMFGFTGAEGPQFASGGFVGGWRKPKPKKAPHRGRHPRVKTTGKLASKTLAAVENVNQREDDLDRAYGQLSRQYEISVDAFGDSLDVAEIDSLMVERGKMLALIDEEKKDLVAAINALKKAIAALVKAIREEKAAINADIKKINLERRRRKDKHGKGGPNQKLITSLEGDVSSRKTRVSAYESQLSDLQGGLKDSNMNLGHVLPFDRRDVELDIMELRQQRVDVIKNIADAQASGDSGGGGGDFGGGGGGGTGGPDQSALIQQLMEELGKLRLTLAVQNVQVPIIGSFQKGVLSVPETGLALVHAGEQITPAGRPSVAGGAAGDVIVQLHFDDSNAYLEKFVRAEAIRATPEIAGRLGRMSDTRRRSGRY
jgi:phage-related protein